MCCEYMKTVQMTELPMELLLIPRPVDVWAENQAIFVAAWFHFLEIIGNYTCSEETLYITLNVS